jgi:hypothetical protein
MCCPCQSAVMGHSDADIRALRTRNGPSEACRATVARRALARTSGLRSNPGGAAVTTRPFGMVLVFILNVTWHLS